MHEPEQLRIDFSEPDPRYPRQHHAQDIRTIGELTVYSITASAGAVKRHPKIIGGVLATVGYGVMCFGLGAKYEEIDRANKPAYLRPADPSTYIDCPSEKISADHLVFDKFFNFEGSYDDLMREKGLGSPEDEISLAFDIISADTPEDALRILQEYTGDTIRVSARGDAKDRQGIYHEFTKTHVLNLARAIHTIPKSLYEYLGASIELVPFIEQPKSPEELKKLSEKDGYVPEAARYSQFSGTYSSGDNKVELTLGTLNTRSDAVNILWHEYVGHGVFMKWCDPMRDSKLHKINGSIGVPYQYMPGWNRTSEQSRLASSGILFCYSYGSTDELEDVATCAEAFGNSGYDAPFTGTVDSGNRSVTDEKQRWLLEELAAIEPDIEQFIAYNSYRSMMGL